MAFPATRFRRLRRTEAIRRLVRETHLAPEHLIQPLFVVPGTDVDHPIAAMPGVSHLSIDQRSRPPGAPTPPAWAAAAVRRARPQGRARLERLRRRGHRAAGGAGHQGRPARAAIVTDVCLCEYTSHGHCGVLSTARWPTTPRSRCWCAWRPRMRRRGRHGGALRHDGRPRGRHPRRPRRRGLHRHADPLVCREVRLRLLRPVPRGGRLRAPGAATAAATRWTLPTCDEALREVRLDVDEGADMVMVKPALAYLDVIRAGAAVDRAGRGLPRVGRVRDGHQAAAQRGWLDERRIVLESLSSIRRAGADRHHCTYHALDFARWPPDPSARRHDPIRSAVPPRASAPSPGGVSSPVRALSPWAAARFHTQGEGALLWDADGHRLPRLRRLVGPHDPGPRLPASRAGDRAGGAARHVLRRALAQEVELAERVTRPCPHREGPLRVVGHRGHHVRAPSRARLHGPPQDPQVRRLLPRPCGRAARRGGLGRGDPRHPRLPGCAGRARGRHAVRALQRRRGRGRP